MTKKQKIIVSTTGIFLVLLILVGLTYAYFLTRIKGNENEKSISVSTANLILEYADIDDIVVGGENVEPGTTWTKKFSATNKGSKKVEYGVALEKVVNTLTRRSDLVYTLNCTSSLGTTCNKVETEHEFPIIGTILITNNIEPEEVQSYELIVSYKEMNEDQSVDMNKKIYAKTNIVDPKTFGALGSGTLASALVESAKTAAASSDQTRTIYKEVPLTSPGNEISMTKYKTENNSGRESIISLEVPVDDTYKNYYWTYSSSYSVDAETGNYTLTDPVVSSLQFKDMYNDLVGKYIASSTISRNCKETQIIAENTKNLNDIYKVITATESKLIIKRIHQGVSESEKSLSLTEDDYGLSYYYRGDIKDNYVNFADMCWRIIRIQGDGSIKLILEDQNTTCNSESYDGNWSLGISNYGYSTVGNHKQKAYLNPVDDKENSMVQLFENFQESKLSDYKKYLKAGDWCINTNGYDYNTHNKLSDEEVNNNYNSMTSFYYEPGLRIISNTLKINYKCNDTVLTKFSDDKEMYVGTFTFDEILGAGAKTEKINYNLYFLNDFSDEQIKAVSSISLYKNNAGSDFKIYYNQKGYVGHLLNVSAPSLARPSIILSSNVKIMGGDGLQSNPYQVKLPTE